MSYYYVTRYIVRHNIFQNEEGMKPMAYNGGPMTEAMYYVLLALMRPNHGYQLMHAITEVSNGRLKMGPGTLYGVLSRMQKDGLISLAKDDGRRKTYQITSEGEQALRVEYSRLKALIKDSNILEEGDGNE